MFRLLQVLSASIKEFPGDMDDPSKLRALASWYRQFAERTGNPLIWEARLLMAEDLDQEADRIEQLERLHRLVSSP